MMLPMRRIATVLVAALACLLAPATAGAALPQIKHVWIVVLENRGYDETFGPMSKAPYLAKTLTSQGQLLTHYYGIGHASLDNYITMVSGQPPNTVTQADCLTYQDFVGTVGSDGVAVGQGCVYPTSVKTIADQLEAKQLAWKGYAEDMAASTTEPKTCRHPQLNQQDHSQSATKDDQYAARHNPFVYFHSIIDRPICNTNVVDLSALPGDLASKTTTPHYSFITPDLCSDGHDTPCADGRPGGLESVNTWLQEWIPKITGSPAYADGGLLIVNFDEAGGSDASDCCGEPMGPNTPNNGGPTQGNGGGRTGAVLLSPYIQAGSVNDTPYNHYSLLRSAEDIFGLPHLAYAAQNGLKPFGDDVFNASTGGGGGGGGPAGDPPRVSVKNVPRGCVKRPFKAVVRATSTSLAGVTVTVDKRRVASRRSKRFSVRVKVAGLRLGGHRLTARATDAYGRTASRTVAFRVCR
jgi:hypothetical protein